jgi:aryl-alcohol dehydrogenase (NADP+)
MEFTKLGHTGLDVSKICLGCMSFGVSSAGSHAWTLGEDDSRAIIRQAIEAGVNFFDTANGYSAGTSEEIVGRALHDYAHRDEVVLATKVFAPLRSGPNSGGLSRKAILAALDASLRRLDVDYIDLYQIHRWDPGTPIEETLSALHDAVRQGKVRYIGASSMYAWQFSKAQYIAEQRGWTKFVSMQNHYNLLYREEEREMMPLCVDQQVAVLPWSPLARGRLARPWDAGTARSETDEFGKSLYVPDDEVVNDRVGEIADQRGTSRAQIALAWTLAKPYVTAPIVGATKPLHLTDAIAALEIDLTAEDVLRLEEPYVPHRTAGFR